MRSLSSISCVLLLIMLISCGQPEASIAPLPTVAQSLPEGPTTYTIDEDMYVYVHSLKERVAKAQLIVVGTVREPAEVINMNRNVEDITKPASDSFGVGQVYKIHIIHYIKGTGQDIINIMNLEGDVLGASATITQAQIDQAKATRRYKPLEISTTYLFFLDPFKGIDFQGTYYVGSLGYPWRMRADADGLQT